jgi:hypothetical protein
MAAGCSEDAVVVPAPDGAHDTVVREVIFKQAKPARNAAR